MQPSSNLLFKYYQTYNPTIAAERSDTRIPERSMYPTFFEIKSFFSRFTIPLKQPMIIPIVERLANDVKKTVKTALKCGAKVWMIGETFPITTNSLVINFVPMY